MRPNTHDPRRTTCSRSAATVAARRRAFEAAGSTCVRRAPSCAPTRSSDPALVMCDLCDRESLVRLGEQFLCASCAMDVLRESVEDLDAVAGARSADPVEILTWGEPETVLAHGLEVGRMVREGTMQLVDAAAAHHQALARSMKRARDTRRMRSARRGGRGPVQRVGVLVRRPAGGSRRAESSPPPRRPGAWSDTWPNSHSPHPGVGSGV